MLANRLRPGDKIAIVSPSNPVTENLLDQFNKGLRFLEDLGFAVIKGKHLFSDSLGYSARPEEKAEDINSLFSDNSVKGIICAQGGSNANSCLQELDWNTIRNNPKVFIGLSDITVILNTIFTKTGLITFHGSDIIWGFGREPSQYDKSEFVDRLMQGKIEKVTAIDDSQTVRKGKSEGKLLGGNLRGFLKLAGTPFFPDINDSILFFEALKITPSGCDYMFNQLKQMGVFNRVNGVVIGHVSSLQFGDNRSQIQMEDILHEVTKEYDFPILKVNNFGHNCPNTFLPVGAKVILDADNKEIEIIESCVL